MGQYKHYFDLFLSTNSENCKQTQFPPSFFVKSTVYMFFIRTEYKEHEALLLKKFKGIRGLKQAKSFWKEDLQEQHIKAFLDGNQIIFKIIFLKRLEFLRTSQELF